jgi:hypothetical protein
MGNAIKLYRLSPRTGGLDRWRPELRTWYYVLRGFDRTSQPRPRISVVTVPTLNYLEVKVQRGAYRSWGKCSVRAIEAHATVGSGWPKVCVTRRKLLTG